MVNRHITQAEIAEQAGVSQSTVSQILSGRHKTIILPETCARVLQVAETLGYHPRTSLPARKAQTRTIA
ncbi:MAG TPA: helix-turn-helix domain-containing protein, partial [Armatimonadota bacterium]|nr:helix-turn-helix domain-containing protein [Armatimonadota bacterium]